MPQPTPSRGGEPLDAPRFFLSQSKRSHLSAAELAGVARWIDAEPTARPHALDRPGLVITTRGLQLYAGDGLARWWHAGFAPRRITRGGDDALVRALDLRPGERVLDGTLGLGHDSLVLAAAGARVTATERSAPLLWFTLDGLWRHHRALARRITGRNADASVAMEGRHHHIYLDPMFPVGGVGPNQVPLRALAHRAPLPAQTLARARECASRRVVLKLPPKAPLPPGAFEVASKRVRYAVYTSAAGG